MSIQQTVNQALAVGAALGTQSRQYQAKLTERKTETEYKTLREEFSRALKAQTMKDEPASSDFYNKIADNLDRQNELKPEKIKGTLSSEFRRLAVTIKKQEEANAKAEVQRLAKEEQRKRIGETIMKV